MSGDFQTSRELFDHPIWKNIVEFRLFFLIYGKAIFSEDGYWAASDLKLERGQWLRSTRKIQEDLSYIENRQIKTYSTSVINRCIKKLEREQRICTKTHELGTVFTVLNYDMYQGFNHFNKKNLEHNLEQHQNSVGTVEEQYQNNNKKEKKEEERKEDIKPLVDRPPVRKKFIQPTLEEVSNYCYERGNRVDPENWLDHYTSNGWKVGKNQMKDWKAAVRTWEKNTTSKTHQSKSERAEQQRDVLKQSILGGASIEDNNQTRSRVDVTPNTDSVSQLRLEY